MTTELTATLGAIVERIAALASEDPQLRSELRRLALAILAATEADPKQEAVAGRADGEAEAIAQAVPAAPVPSMAEERLPSGLPAVAASPPVPLGSATKEPPAVPPAPPVEPPQRSWRGWMAPVTDDDLPGIEARCRLKAEGARWAATRRRRIAEGADFPTEIEPKDRDIIARAKALPDCFLWMCHPSGPSPTDQSLYRDVAGCFDAVAEALSLIRTVLEDPDRFEGEFGPSLDLLAEAQSALRAAIARMDGPNDSDQDQVFRWLRRTASVNQVFIPRFLRADDPADPTRWADLSSRIVTVDSRLQEVQKKGTQRKKLLGKLRHKLSLIGSNPSDAADHWSGLAMTIDELVSLGVPPSNTEIRELLLPLIDDVPEMTGSPRGFELVLREIDRFLATCPSAEPAAAVKEPTAAVQQAARLLEGQSMVLIGGERRPAAAEALKRSLGLQELYWIETREHQSTAGFEAYIARPDVAVVLLAIRWSSHAFGDVKEFCDEHDKPLVRLPAGYNPNQVAVQILAQCSGRLRPRSSRRGTNQP